MTMAALHSAGYYPPPAFGSTAPIRVDIEMDREPDRTGPIPLWSYAIEVKLASGQNWTWGGTLEAANEHQAELRVHSKTVARLAELLADFATRMDAVSSVRR